MITIGFNLSPGLGSGVGIGVGVGVMGSGTISPSQEQKRPPLILSAVPLQEQVMIALFVLSIIPDPPQSSTI